MWVILALVSALCLGFYDIFKKLSVKGNDVLMVLMLNTVFGALYMSPFLIDGISQGNRGFGNSLSGHLQILLKSAIVLGSWLLGYFAIKHLPLTVQGPINASRPVIVLVGALLIFGERLNWIQWLGITLGFTSLFFISRIGAKEGFSIKHSKWIWMSIGATFLGAVSALYDKYLLKSFSPIEVQGWYSLYQCFIMVITISIIKGNKKQIGDKFVWRWTIPCIALFLTVADMAYFYSLSLDGSMVAIVSMIRRGSVIVSFLYGVIALHEKNIKPKLIDLSILLLSLALLVIGSQY
ncbi:MAG: DMT family transporter [Muribaculaceae bacterium]|nr:DMT family transporter [Muribaculaceae bacterium]